jgi:hypothetical protein
MTSVQAQPVLVQPNQFSVGGYKFGITYETTSITGTPRLSFTSQGQTLNFIGKEIQVEQTQLGQIVTVNLGSKANQVVGFYGNNPGNQGLIGDNSVSQDGIVESLTLLVPTVNLSPNNLTSPVQMLAIFSLRSRTVKIADQTQYYMPLSLYGTASKIDF